MCSSGVYGMVSDMMADQLLLLPAVDPEDATACAERWRSERIAEVAIMQFGDAARAKVRQQGKAHA